MYIPNYPEDSVLRRHADSAARLRCQALLARPPSDSVLRRHFEQLHGASRPTATATAPRAAAPKPIPPGGLRQAPPPPPRKTGLFGWVGRLFGR